MIELTPNECRVLGVLIEKAQTTPQQYPLSLNALLSGCNQKNNRDPVLNLDEDTVFDTVESLRSKALVRELMLSGSRVAKYRHIARETLAIDTNELVILAELLLRGPQTLGELRGRASRMHPLETIEVVQNILQHLMDRDPPFVKAAPPEPGSRAGRFAQLLCPKLHRIDSAAASHPSHSTAPTATPSSAPSAHASQQDDTLTQLTARIAALEDEVARLRALILGSHETRAQ